MRAQLRRRLEMAERVRTFLRAHQLEGGVEGLGLETLEALIAREQVLDEQQRVGLNLSRQATKQRRTVRQALEEKILRYLRAVGRVAAKHNGELANEFPLPASNASHKALLTVGRAALGKATAQKDVLGVRGVAGGGGGVWGQADREEGCPGGPGLLGEGVGLSRGGVGGVRPPPSPT